MATDRYKELLKAIPEIAKAVNSLSSPDVQKSAFDRLAEALLDKLSSPPTPADTQKGTAPAGPTSTSKKKVKKAKGAKKGSRKSETPSIDRDLNLHPAKGPSFKDFCAEKGPKGYPEFYAVAVYYLKNNLRIENVTPSQVYTCMKDVKLRAPADMLPNMRNAAHRTGYIDTSDQNDIRVSVTGTNLVEHDLPRKKDE